MPVGRSHQRKSTNQKRRELVRVDNTKRVLDGMLEGKTARAMAAEYKLSVSTVHELINEAIRSIPPLDVEAWRAIMLEQSQSVLAANMVKRGNPQNAKVCLAAVKMIGDITGAFAPKEIDVTGTIVTQAVGEELIAKLARLAGEEPDGPDIEVTLMEPEPDEIRREQLSGDAGGEAEEDTQEPQP